MTTKPYLMPFRKKVGKRICSTKYDWFKLKKEFLSDPTMTYAKLAERHSMPVRTIQNRGNVHRWLALRTEIMKRAEEKALREIESKHAEIKFRHATIGKSLQAEGIQAINQKKKKPRTAKEALGFVTEGVRIEREAEGMEKEKGPQVVNIIQTQKRILEKYKVEEARETK